MQAHSDCRFRNNDNCQCILNTKYMISRHFSNNRIFKDILEEKEDNWTKTVP